MDCLKIWFLSFCLAHTFFTIQAQVCRNDKNKNNIFYRTIILKSQDSYAKDKVTREELEKVYGQCNAVQHSAKVLEFFESYGFDLEEVRANPFQYYSGDQYELSIGFLDGNYSVYMTSLFDFVSFENSHAYTGWWQLKTKVDVNTPKGLLRKGSNLWTGIDRIVLHNREFCIYFALDRPAVDNPEGLYPVDGVGESPEWGSGGLRGLYKVDPTEVWAIYTFPAVKP